MIKLAVSAKIRVIGVINVIIGGFIGFWLLTVGLFITLYSYDLNKTPSIFVGYFLGLVFGALFMIGGIGLIRHRTWCRKILNLTWGLSILLMAFYVLGELKYGFSADGIGYEFFDIWSWLGGIIFWSVTTALGILHIRFINNDRVKEQLE